MTRTTPHGVCALTSACLAVACVLMVGPAGSTEAAFMVLTALGAVVWAAAVRSRDRSRFYRVLREQAVTQATHRERLRMAEHVHDLVSHRLAAITLQASTEPLLDEAAARSALRDIETNGRAATVDMRRLLKTLRDPCEQGSPDCPLPGADTQALDLDAPQHDSCLQRPAPVSPQHDSCLQRPALASPQHDSCLQRPAPVSSVPGTATSLPQVLTWARSAGLEVEATGTTTGSAEGAATDPATGTAAGTASPAGGTATGTVPATSTQVARTLTAVVQEALANVARHAGRVRVRVRLGRDGDQVWAAVDNDAPAPSHQPAPGAGTGLAVLRRRCAALGGHLTAAPTVDGFRVEVRIPDPPLPETQLSPSRPPSPDSRLPGSRPPAFQPEP